MKHEHLSIGLLVGILCSFSPESFAQSFHSNGTTDSLSMVQVTGGTFTVGTTLVTISSFKIEKYEVTYEIWTEVRNWALIHGYTDLGAGQNGLQIIPISTNNPVVYVNWYDVVKWCNARSDKDGLTPVYYTDSAQNTVYRTGEIKINIDAVKWAANGYRLPTDAEWEFAARGGGSTQNYIYSGSNTVGDVAWYSDNSGGVTHTVGQKAANELGIYDMSGNAWEWCWDWYGDTYPSGGTADPKGPSTTQTDRLRRSGSIYVSESSCRVVKRQTTPPSDRTDNGGSPFGFRCVKQSEVTTVHNVSETEIPKAFSLFQNYPNPFNPSTTMKFELPKASMVRLSVYDILGREVLVLVNERREAGVYEVKFDASGLSSGIYFYRLQAGDFVQTRKLLLLR